MLNRHSRINEFSIKKIEEMKAEPVHRTLTCYVNHTRYDIPRVSCNGGVCECGCGQEASFGNELHPHEKTFRSHGGKLTLDNSIMVLNACHERLQKNYLQWSKDDD